MERAGGAGEDTPPSQDKGILLHSRGIIDGRELAEQGSQDEAVFGKGNHAHSDSDTDTDADEGVDTHTHTEGRGMVMVNMDGELRSLRGYALSLPVSSMEVGN